MHSNTCHITFDEVSKQVCHLKEVILWDIQRGFERESMDADVVTFAHHMVVTKYWFIRVSSTNKKRFIMVLLEDIHSAWTLSLLLKAIWNCYPKDAVSSAYEPIVWSTYDQVPMDHNRSAMPIETLVEVMEADRKRFRTLEPYHQAEFLSELLKISGGPIVWAVFHKAQTIFENYREDQLHNIHECMAVIETHESGRSVPLADDKNKKDPRQKSSESHGDADAASQIKQPAAQDAAQRELEMYLAQWNSIIKSIKDSQKLEEVELSFNDGTKKRMWKVNRPKPEVIETVDYLQLLPLAVAKRVLSFVPQTQLNDCARVNRYWAYLVDEFKAELAARLKIDLDIEMLTELMLQHDITDQSLATFQTVATTTSYSAPASRQLRRQTYSQRPSQKSAATTAFKRVLHESKKKRIKLPPLRNLAELSERLDRRGAADENLWDWCKIILQRYNKPTLAHGALPPILDKQRSSVDGIMVFGNFQFPCPLMKMSVKLPLKPALCKDPTKITYLKKKKKILNISNTKVNFNKRGNGESKRYNLWSRDFSSLYTAFKIPYYKSPV